MENNSKSPAFPLALKMDDLTFERGLTKREYIAALAMQGISSRESSGNPTQVAEAAIMYADALVKRLNQE